MGTVTRLQKLVVLSLAVFALALPAAASASEVPALGTYHATEQDSSVSTPQVSSPDSGFEWGDAALGATAMLAIGIVAAGGALYVRSYRHSHQVSPTS